MLTENPSIEAAAVPLGSNDRGVPGERLTRLAQRRQLVREEMLVIAALLALLLATVAILATQWLASGPSAGATAPSYLHLVLGGTT